MRRDGFFSRASRDSWAKSLWRGQSSTWPVVKSPGKEVQSFCLICISVFPFLITAQYDFFSLGSAELFSKLHCLINYVSKNLISVGQIINETNQRKENTCNFFSADSKISRPHVTYSNWIYLSNVSGFVLVSRTPLREHAPWGVTALPHVRNAYLFFNS